MVEERRPPIIDVSEAAAEEAAPSSSPPPSPPPSPPLPHAEATSSPPPPPPPPPPHDWRLTRINGAVLLAMLAFFLHRVSSVGLVEAVAEAVGLSDTYAYWSTAYWPLQPELFRSQPPSYWLDPSLATAIALPNATHRTNALLDLVHDHGNGIYSLWLLREDAALRLAREVDHFVYSGHVSAQPNSMNDHGVVIGEDGMEGLDDLMRLIVKDVLTPLAAALYGAYKRGGGGMEDGEETAVARAARAVDASSCCSAHHAFVVRYNESDCSQALAASRCSEVTPNVCLQREEEEEVVRRMAEAVEAAQPHSSQLRFCGLVGEANHRRETLNLRHSVGKAVIHLGAHRHGATDLRHGARQNLIVWGRRGNTAQQASAAHGGSASGYHEVGSARLHPNEEPPDRTCLSYHHDRDYTLQYESMGLPLPADAALHFEKEQQRAELLDLAGKATDAHIAQLPEHHRPIVRMLRQAAQQQQQAGV